MWLYSYRGPRAKRAFEGGMQPGDDAAPANRGEDP